MVKVRILPHTLLSGWDRTYIDSQLTLCGIVEYVPWVQVKHWLTLPPHTDTATHYTLNAYILSQCGLAGLD